MMAEAVLKTDVEAETWRLSCSEYPGKLAQMLQDALDCYSRRPGLDDLSRIHLATLTDLGFQVLGEVLESRSRHAWHIRHSDHIELRWQLREHLKRQLQMRLIHDGLASSSIRDERFAADLGL